jgi:hypothetical protein
MAKKLTKEQLDATMAEPEIVVPDTKRPDVSVELNLAAMSVIVKFGTGEYVTLATHEISVDIANQALLLGLSNKLRDAAALPIRTIDGKVTRPTVADKFAAVSTMATQLKSGKWSADRETVGPFGPLWNAMNVLKPGAFADKAAFVAWLETKAEAERVRQNNPRIKAANVAAALSREGPVKAEIERQQAERGTPVADTGGMLAELGI